MPAESTSLQCVGDWLESLALPQYENLLIANGFDDMEFMGADVIEPSDLLQIGVTDAQHVKTIVESSATLPRVKLIGEYST